MDSSMIGSKIKEYRCKNGLTQKDLADRLHVTYQAVSRWENDAAEPSFDCLIEMTKIFNCTLDDLFGIEKPTTPGAEEREEPIIVPQEKTVERVIVKEAPKLLAICDECKTAIYDEKDIHRVTIRNGKTSKTKTVCSECNRKYLREAAQKKEAQEKKEKADSVTRRKRAFIWGAVFAAIGLIACIIYYVRGDNKTGTFFLVEAPLAFSFVGCLFLNNNIIPELWLTIAGWGFVKMPGVIMELSPGGLIIGFLIKIFLWVLGLIIAIAVVFLATLLGMLISPFVYPFALSRNIKGKDEGTDGRSIKHKERSPAGSQEHISSQGDR